MNEKALEIAKLIGDPVNPSLPVPVALEKICNIDTAEPGEKVYVWDNEDIIPEEMYQINANGTLTLVEADLLGDTELQFKTFTTPMRYIRVDKLLQSPDQSKLASLKRSLTTSADKQEVYMVLKAIRTGGVVDTVTPDAGDDLYDLIVKTIEQVEDYGDGYVLLAGTKLYSKIKKYDKDQAGTFNYKVGLLDYLKEEGVELVKVFGKITNDDGNDVDLLPPSAGILVAVRSDIAAGKPIVFVRRKFNAEIANNMNAEVDAQQRAIVLDKAPIQVSGQATVAYGIFAMESFVSAILNKRVIKNIDASSLV